jgi:hypothetical protein
MSKLYCKPLFFPRVTGTRNRSVGFMIRQFLQSGGPVGACNFHPPLNLNGRLGWLFTAQGVVRFGGEAGRIRIQQRLKAGEIEIEVTIKLGRLDA